ncbi:MAG TPA: hypothetical protein VFD83_02015, partial [Candidatus Polarisedimenticolia bacterium]|nr:hypothetical protein [Candidatus Polarisedimenticolia bacterium]
MFASRVIRGVSLLVMSCLATISIACSNDSPRVMSPSPEVIHSDADIAFYSNRTGNFEIYSMYADGRGQANLTRNHALDMDPSWSGDGTKIAFMSDRDGNWEIYSMDPDGSHVTRLTS